MPDVSPHPSRNDKVIFAFSGRRVKKKASAYDGPHSIPWDNGHSESGRPVRSADTLPEKKRGLSGFLSISCGRTGKLSLLTMPTPLQWYYMRMTTNQKSVDIQGRVSYPYSVRTKVLVYSGNFLWFALRWDDLLMIWT
jgi:hypothetical protein